METKKSNKQSEKNHEFLKNLLNETKQGATKIKGKKKGSTTSIYQAWLFKGMGTDEKKKQRNEYRKILDNYLDKFFFNRNNKVELKKLADLWNKYAKEIYIDVNNICNLSFTDSDKIESIKEFVATMEKFRNEKKSNPKPKKVKQEKTQIEPIILT